MFIEAQYLDTIAYIPSSTEPAHCHCTSKSGASREGPTYPSPACEWPRTDAHASSARSFDIHTQRRPRGVVRNVTHRPSCRRSSPTCTLCASTCSTIRSPLSASPSEQPAPATTSTRRTHHPPAVAHGARVGFERRTVGVFEFVARRQHVDGIGASTAAPRRVPLVVVAWPA